MPHAGRSEARNERTPLVRRSRGEALAQSAITRVHPKLTARLGVDEAKLADIGELLLARVAHLDGEHGVAAGEPQQRPPPVERPAEVRDDDDERALARDLVGELQRVAQRAGAGRRKVAQQVQRVEQRAPALARPLDRRLGAERDRAEPVAAPRRRIADRDRDAFGDVGLAPVGGAERHRRRRVEHEPRDEHALGELDAHVRLAGARRHVPLDPAHVVARLVRTHLPQLAADTGERRPVVAGEQPVDAAADRQLERAQRRRRERPRARDAPACGRERADPTSWTRL